MAELVALGVLPTRLPFDAEGCPWSLHGADRGPYHRPIDVRVDPAGEYVYVLDFGDFELTPDGVEAKAASGALWRAPLATL